MNTSTERIEKTPGICGGRARIAGHRIRVMDIVVLLEKPGMSPEAIVQQYPGISVADVQAAGAYFLLNRAEIEEEFRKDEEAVNTLLARHSSKVHAKLNG